jgi:hypothetical protein
MGMQLQSDERGMLPMDEAYTLDVSTLPVRMRFQSFAGTACAVDLPDFAGDDLAFFSGDGRLELTVSPESITFDCPSLSAPITLYMSFNVGDELTIRPLAVAPPAEETCQHGISPKGNCPLNPP